jgi:hypothetical protein
LYSTHIRLESGPCDGVFCRDILLILQYMFSVVQGRDLGMDAVKWLYTTNREKYLKIKYVLFYD